LKSNESERRKITPLDGVRLTPGERDARAVGEFEQDVVNHLFRHFRLESFLKSHVIEWTYTVVGVRQLSLPGFDKVFPSFPMQLQVQKFRHLPEHLTVSRFFSDLRSQPFIKAYRRLLKEAPEDVREKPIGLVFHWPFLRGGLVIHDQEPDLNVPGVRVFWTCEHNRTFTIEPLTLLLLTIDRLSSGGRWSPDES
jgi:hypothetical protein